MSPQLTLFGLPAFAARARVVRIICPIAPEVKDVLRERDDVRRRIFEQLADLVRSDRRRPRLDTLRCTLEETTELGAEFGWQKRTWLIAKVDVE
jgi:hypothetical protein